MRHYIISHLTLFSPSHGANESAFGGCADVWMGGATSASGLQPRLCLLLALEFKQEEESLAKTKYWSLK